MPSPATGPGWDVQRLHGEVRFAEFLLHLLTCARDPERGPWSAHLERTHERAAAATAAKPRHASTVDDLPYVMGVDRGPDDLGPEATPTVAAGPPQERLVFDPTHDLANLIAHAEAAGIAVTWSDLDVSIGGFVYRPRGRTGRRREPRAAPADLDARRLPRVTIGDLVVVLNPAQAWIATLELLLHELAHALLGHLGPAPSVRQGTDLIPVRARPSWDAREFEANVAALVAAQRRGSPARRIGLKVMLHFVGLERAGEVGIVDLLQVFRVAETLAAWCAIRPDTVGVRAAAPPPPADPPARAREAVADRERAEPTVPVSVRSRR
jgi:hypothetical protein